MKTSTEQTQRNTIKVILFISALSGQTIEERLSTRPPVEKKVERLLAMKGGL